MVVWASNWIPNDIKINRIKWHVEMGLITKLELI